MPYRSVDKLLEVKLFDYATPQAGSGKSRARHPAADGLRVPGGRSSGDSEGFAEVCWIHTARKIVLYTYMSISIYVCTYLQMGLYGMRHLGPALRGVCSG